MTIREELSKTKAMQLVQDEYAGTSFRVEVISGTENELVELFKKKMLEIVGEDIQPIDNIDDPRWINEEDPIRNMEKFEIRQRIEEEIK